MNTKFVLGTVQFGMNYGINNSAGQPTKEEVFDILDHAYANRISQLDTAGAYGDSQRIIGEFMRARDKTFLINTKFQVGKTETIREQLLHALKELWTNKINTYFFHRFQDVINFPEVLAELQSLKKAGLINGLGVSVYTNDEFSSAISISSIDVIQFPFNLLDNYSKRGHLIRQAKANGKTLQARSVFLQGLFFKNTQSWPDFLHPLSKYMKQLEAVANEHNLGMYDMALAYVLSKKEIDQLVIGVDSKAQLAANLKVGQLAVSDDVFGKIDSIDVKEEALLYPYNWK